MKKLLLILMLATVSNSAMAKWIEAGNYNGFDPVVITAYADPASIRKVGGIVKMRVLIDYKPVEIVEMVDGKQQKYVIGKIEPEEPQVVEFECKEAQSQSIISKWAPISPDSIDEKLWEFACGK
jgi:hypothetical protein